MIADILGTVVSRGLSALMLALTSILIARTLGLEKQGLLYYMTTTAMLAAQLSTMGLTSSNAYLAARNNGVAPSLLTNGIWISLLVAPIAILLLMQVFPPPLYADDRSIPLSLWPMLIAPFALLYLLHGSVLAGLERFGLFNIAAVGGSLFYLLTVIVLAASGAGIDLFLAATFAYYACLAIATGIIVVKQVRGGSRFLPDKHVFMRGFQFGIRAYIVTLCGFITARMPVLGLAQIADAHAVGRMSICVLFAEALSLIPGSAAFVLFPRLVKLEPRERAARTWASAGATLAVMAVLCGLLALFAEPLIALLFGQDFSSVVRPLQLMLPGVVFLSASAVLGQHLAARAFPGRLIALWAVVTLLTGALTILLGERHGAEGAAVAISIGYWMLFIGTSTLVLADDSAARRQTL